MRTRGRISLSSLLAAEADGERLTQTDLANAILLLQAGHETTQDLARQLAGGALPAPRPVAVAEGHPGARRQREEFLRYDASVQMNHRVALDGT